MTPEEYENAEWKTEGRTIDCFCGCGCTNLRVHAYVVRDHWDPKKCYKWDGITDDITFTLRCEPWYAKAHTLASIWNRVKACWHMLFRGHYDLYQCTGKLRDWQGVATWLNSLEPVTDDEGRIKPKCRTGQMELFSQEEPAQD